MFNLTPYRFKKKNKNLNTIEKLKKELEVKKTDMTNKYNNNKKDLNTFIDNEINKLNNKIDYLLTQRNTKLYLLEETFKLNLNDLEVKYNDKINNKKRQNKRLDTLIKADQAYIEYVLKPEDSKKRLLED